MKKRNMIAKDLFTPKYKPRVTKSIKEYSRKVKHKAKIETDENSLYFGLMSFQDINI